MSIPWRSRFVLPLFFLAPACQLLPAPSPERPPEERLLELAQRDNRVMDHLRHLTKEIGPRLTGSTNFDRAAGWCAEQFRSWGLEARLEKWGEFDMRFDRGPQRARVVSPIEKDLVFKTNAWSKGTPGPLRAAALLEPADDSELASVPQRFAGAWVVKRPKSAESKLQKRIDQALEQAKVAGYVRGARGDLLQMAGSSGLARPKSKAAKQPGEPEPPRDLAADLAAMLEKSSVQVTLRKDHYEELLALLEKPLPVELEIQSENRFTPGPIACNNVIADLVGREFPDEYVIVGGHLDSWDGAEGAQDNGTGVCSTLEAARLIASLGVKPRRTIRFVLFGGEEQGLYGSQGYVKTHAGELARTSVVLVHDGGQNPLQGLQVTYAMLPDFQRILGPLATLDPARPVAVEETLGLVNSGDSDHAPFLGESAGVPAFFWQQSSAGYEEHVHHTQYDTLETVQPADEQHNARVVALAAWGLAELDHRLDRTDMQPLARRRLGVSDFKGASVVRVLGGGRADKAGWKDGDVVLSIDGVAVGSRDEIVRLVNTGGPKKIARIRRGSEELDTELDWSEEKDEPERALRAERRAAWLRAHGGT